METSSLKLIHVAVIRRPEGVEYLRLRQISVNRYEWFEKKGEEEIQTAAAARTIEEAIRLGRKQWKEEEFRLLNCGFRYTLPERDEHGNNALFYQMVASYSSMNGIYVDEELGSNCIVQFASDEARRFWSSLA